MQNGSQSDRPSQLNALPSLRFFAAALIVFHHSIGSFGISPEIGNYFPNAQAVSFFFVLSGFVLAYSYKSLDNSKAIKSFLISRIARVWPLHIVSLILLIILLPCDLWVHYGGKGFSIWPLLSQIFMVQAWIPTPDYYFSYNAVSWAVSALFGCYLFFPLLIYKWDKTWHIKLLSTFLILVGIIAYCSHYGITGELKGGIISYTGLTFIHPLSRMFEFSLGMVMASAFNSIKIHYQPGKMAGTMVELMMLLLVIEVMRATSFNAAISYGLSPVVNTLVTCGTLSSLFFGMLILFMAFEKGAISSFLSLPIFKILGSISFAVYLLHQILIRYYIQKFQGFISLPNWLIYICFLILLIILSWLLYQFIEKPCRKLISI